MSRCPNNLRYSSSHEWVRVEEDGSVTVGITDYAQGLLGNIVYVELPQVGMEYSQGDEIAVVESVRTTADIYTPISGKVIAVNDKLTKKPGYINQDPYLDGWLFRLQAGDMEELLSLMNTKNYLASIREQQLDIRQLP